ncbi:MAG: HEAT repeat domain-containing protein, partial [Nannocystaceae bacterium]
MIEPWLLHALGDPSTSVKREALRICFERELASCVPSALTLWSAVSEPTLRVVALRVVALEPEGAGFDALAGALRDDNDTMRAQAAQILGWARLHGATRERAIAALLAKLGDLSANVRLFAVESLGLLGAQAATLALARLLDDAEPTVRMATARALGQIGDARVAAAIARALQAPNEPPVTRSILAALALLPGDEADRELLAALDETPAGLSSNDVGELLGLRPSPSQAFLDGVAARLRDPAGARTAVRVLVGLGPDAAATLRGASQRGPAPEVALELQRALASLDVPQQVPGPLASPPRVHAPLQASDFDALSQAPAIDSLTRAVALRDRLDPRVAAARLGLDAPVHERRSELAIVALAGGRAALGADDLAALGRVMGWRGDAPTTETARGLAARARRGADRHGEALELA